MKWHSVGHPLVDPQTGLGVFRSGRPITLDDVKAFDIAEPIPVPIMVSYEDKTPPLVTPDIR